MTLGEVYCRHKGGDEARSRKLAALPSCRFPHLATVQSEIPEDDPVRTMVLFEVAAMQRNKNGHSKNTYVICWP